MLLSFPLLRFHAFHGALSEEHIIGGDFEVNLTLHINDYFIHDALWNDNLDATVNYADIYKLVKQETAISSQLIENVAARIARRILCTYEKVGQVDISVTKCSPPIQGFDGKGATVSLSLPRRMVVWDFDGTIADTSEVIVRTMKATFQQLNWSIPNTEAIIHTIGLPLLQSFAILSKDKTEEEYTRAMEVYRKIFDQIGMTGIKLFDGISETLHRQSKEGFVVAIATSRGHESVEILCTQLGIRPYINYIVACEDVNAHKPNPAPVKYLYKETHIAPIHTTVIGDTTYDISMGINARVGCVVGVAWGNHSSKMLYEAGADLVLDNPNFKTDILA